MSVGSDSSASDNHTCQRETGEALKLHALVCVCTFTSSFLRGNGGRKEGRNTRFQSSDSDPIGSSFLPAGILRGSRHQYFLITPEAQSANTDFI